MNKFKFFATMLAMSAIGASFVACDDDDDNEIPMVNHVVKLTVPMGLQDVTVDDATVTMTNNENGKEYTSSQFVLVNDEYVDTVTVPQGIYTVNVRGKVSYMLHGTKVSNNVKSTQENVPVNYSATIESKSAMALVTYNAKEGFVISEIFFTGTLTPEGKQYSDDQYIKIANNSDSTLYLDGLAIVESEFLTTDKQDYTPDLMNEAMSIDAIYLFPGSGKDYPLEAGKEILVAVNAKDHREFNANSFDLSKADFEFYDDAENPDFQDEQNPNVPDLMNWYDYSYSYFGFHNRGFKAYALAKPECDMETFVKDYLYTATYVFTFGEYSFDMDTECYKLPNSWIVDAVNLSVEDSYQWNVTASSLDAGWAHCGSVDHDQNRYGKSVIRKKDGGKWIDTNNSTNDFESDAQASLFK